MSTYESTPTDDELVEAEVDTTGDNALDTDNDAYVGVDDVYKNHANDTEAPHKVDVDGHDGDDDRDVEREAQLEQDAIDREAAAKESATKIGPTGIEPRGTSARDYAPQRTTSASKR